MEEVTMEKATDIIESTGNEYTDQNDQTNERISCTRTQLQHDELIATSPPDVVMTGPHQVISYPSVIPTTAKKKSRALRIVDPNTNAEVDLSFLSDKRNPKVVGNWSSGGIAQVSFIDNGAGQQTEDHCEIVEDEAAELAENSSLNEMQESTCDSVQDPDNLPSTLFESRGEVYSLTGVQNELMISGGEIYFDTGLQHLPAEMIGSGNIGHSEQVQEIQLQSSSPTKTSHAIKIINPDTSTEIELPPRPKPKRRTRIVYDREFLLGQKDSPLSREAPSDLRKFSMFVGQEQVIERSCQVPKKSKKKAEKKKVKRHDKETKPSIVPVKKASLHITVEPWRPKVLIDKRDILEEEAESIELYHKLQGILNKLTLQKFQILAEQAVGLEIKSEKRLIRCVEIVLHNVAQEPMFAALYAKIFQLMSSIMVDYKNEEDLFKQTSFKTVFITVFQKELAKEKNEDKTMTTLQKEIENAKTEERRAALIDEMELSVMKWKKRMLSYYQFMGELLRLQMLSEELFYKYIDQLLKSPLDEENLEFCVALLSATGQVFDKEQSKQQIDIYFERIKTIIEEGKVSSRIRFLLLNLVELRDRQWVPRPRQEMKIKTIDQIHAEAAESEAEEKEALKQSKKSKTKKSHSRDSHASVNEDKESSDAIGDFPPDKLETLSGLLTSCGTSNNDIIDWVKKNCVGLASSPALLVTKLTSAVVQASVSGSGDQAVFHQELFERRMDVMKAQGHYGVAVLHGFQCSVAKLSHPPKLLSSLFDVVYDLELVDEQEFYTWRDDDKVMYGKGAALASVKPFFDWLKSDSRIAGQT